MPMTSRFVIRSTIGLLTVGFLTLIAIVGTTIWLGERSRIYFNEVVDARDMRVAAVELRNALVAAESSQRGYIATENEIYLAPFNSAKAQTVRQLELLKRTVPRFPDTEPLFQRLDKIVADKIIEMDQTIALKTEGRNDEALAILRTNRGKALNDEANVFLSSIILRADDRVSAGIAEQTANATWLRWVSIIGSLVIVLVVGGVLITVMLYAREILQARDEVRKLNVTLEDRVNARTAELSRARDRAEVLLAEVNHRVANSLSLVASLVTLQSKAVTDQSAKDALAETEARIYAIASVHKRLYTSGDVHSVALHEYLSSVLDHLAQSLRDKGSGASLVYELEPLTLKTDTSINLGVVATELVTNAFKYAYPNRSGEVRVKLKSLADQRVELVVEDDGVGRNGRGTVKGTGLGTRIVNAMAGTMKAEIEYLERKPGTTARLTFPLQPV
jgi:two-component sensor histidine kinase/CHASE3 domain sensor protein